jgi:hypothetical protein
MDRPRHIIISQAQRVAMQDAASAKPPWDEVNKGPQVQALIMGTSNPPKKKDTSG